MFPIVPLSHKDFAVSLLETDSGCQTSSVFDLLPFCSCLLSSLALKLSSFNFLNLQSPHYQAMGIKYTSTFLKPALPPLDIKLALILIWCFININSFHIIVICSDVFLVLLSSKILWCLNCHFGWDERFLWLLPFTDNRVLHDKRFALVQRNGELMEFCNINILVLLPTGNFLWSEKTEYRRLISFLLRI